MNPQKKQKQKHDRGLCIPGIVKVAMGLIGACLVGYIVGPPLYWQITDAIASVRRSSCPPCFCDCSSHPILSLREGLNSNIFTGCMKHDPELSEELENNIADLLSEEIEIREAEALEKQRRADMALLEAKKTTSQYQKEADKCNAGMESCEEAREKAEAALEAQKELSTMWELRARQKGWRERPL